ncbi:F0F1 ATP synthase subunit delta [Thalassobacillus hwangdonensis]|uniref:ATP synthase subunit delta n=1 Tax=Thalassobacillus hwangdonensis TaxID=546108 RepID=A0ABW3L5S2_9BACI
MSEAVVSKRYAQALFQLGQERNIMDTLEQELLTVREVWATNKKFTTFLQHPKVTISKKKTVLSDVFQGFSKEVVHTLHLLADRHREEIIPEVIAHFITLVNESKGIAEAKVYSVRELSEEEKVQISSVFAQKLGKNQLKITNIIDPSILGGIKLRIGNRIYDGTVKGKLERMERKLVSANNR